MPVIKSTNPVYHFLKIVAKQQLEIMSTVRKTKMKQQTQNMVK